MSRTKQFVPKSQIAKELGLSKARISQLTAAGLPTRPDGKVDRVKALAWYAANVREQMKPGPKSAAKSGLRDEHAEVHRAVSRAAGDMVEQARGVRSVALAKKEAALAARAEMEAAKMRGDLVAVAEVQKAVYGMISNARNRLLGIGSKLGPALAMENDPLTCQSLVDEQIREALEELKQYRPAGVISNG